MATCREIITGALYELAVVQLGEAPAPEEAARGMIVMQSLYREAVDKGVFGRLSEYMATGDYEAEEQQRVYAAGYTITLPTSITDETTGRERRPKDLAMVQVVEAGSDPEISIYDAHVGAWVRIDNLALASEAPFSGRARHALECAVAARLSNSVPTQPSQGVLAYAAGLALVLGQRLSAPREETRSDYY